MELSPRRASVPEVGVGGPPATARKHLGIARCSLHGGSTPAAGGRARRDLALREVAVMGGRVEIEPTQALLECVYRAAGQAAWLRGKVEWLSSTRRCAWVRTVGQRHIRGSGWSRRSG